MIGPPGLPWLRSVPVPRTLTAVPDAATNRPDDVTVSQKVRCARYTVHERLCVSADRAGVLLKWADLLIQPERTQVGQMLLNCFGDGKMVTSTPRDVFRPKATSTLKTRVRSMGMCIGWLTASFVGEDVLPVCEARLYEFTCECRDEGISSSRMDTSIATLSYAGNALKSPGAAEAASSPKVQGAAFELLLNRRPRVRAPMLPPEMVNMLVGDCMLRFTFGLRPGSSTVQFVLRLRSAREPDPPLEHPGSICGR